jgi:hypothetical protein
MQREELQVQKGDLSTTRVVQRAVDALQADDVLFRVERFGLTANNLTYGVVGDRFGYWRFFPAEGEWGTIPVWGIGEVVETRHPDVPKGERVYGYFPMASHLTIKAGKVSAARMVDGAEHRRELAPLYNNYARLAGEPDYDTSLDDARIPLLPLYATSYCLYDYLVDRQWFGARQVILVSGSSKTAIGLAYALRDDNAAPYCVGITSARHAAAVNDLALYEHVATYDALTSVDPSRPTVVVDTSGNDRVLGRLQAYLGDSAKYCVKVGFTHAVAQPTGAGDSGGRGEFFFAPGHIKKRAAEWGPGEFERRSLRFWRAAAMKSRDWLTIERVDGAKAVEQVFHALREDKVAANRGIVAAITPR